MRVVGGNTLEFHSEELGSIPDARSTSPIVQLVEQQTVNLWDIVSSPIRVATLYKIIKL